jgi:hypothetical protein
MDFYKYNSEVILHYYSAARHNKCLLEYLSASIFFFPVGALALLRILV